MSSDDNFEWLTPLLAAADISSLDQIAVSVAPEKDLGLITLLAGWREHVARIEGEVVLPDTDEALWGVWDYAAALTLRSFIARGLKLAEMTSVVGYRRALDMIDDRFRRITEEDVSGFMRRVDRAEASNADRYEPPSVDEWWWDRVLRIGPIRREIERMESAY